LYSKIGLYIKIQITYFFYKPIWKDKATLMGVMNSLVRQRLSYLRYGNRHGVSPNWISKNVDSSFSDVYELGRSVNAKTMIDVALLKEGEEVFMKILDKCSGVTYSRNFDCEKGMASFLYANILTIRPNIVVETGVANGISTNVIMHALEQTGGKLHSFDVDQRCSSIYDGSGDWNFHLLKGNLKRSLESEIKSIGAIDYWIHDSNHGYSWQSFEYQLAGEVLAPKGMLISDDIDASTAWGLLDKSPFNFVGAVFDTRKMFGIAQKK
jgi:hypothetical protein